ncbi:MAG: hypothetical protein ACREQ4_16445 [Candidatus Binataceae bacterium]
MELTDQQIERYSRQILIAPIGGVGQERLLQSRLLIAGESEDTGPVLAYMAGAGVGTIQWLAGSADDAQEAARAAALIAETRALNRDVKVSRTRDLPAESNLALVLISGAAALEAARALCAASERPTMVFARLAEPGQIAAVSSTPCPVCADSQIMAPLTRRAANARLIAMLAAAEALKLLANATTPTPTLIEFAGYVTRTRPLTQAASGPAMGANRCACAAIANRNAGARDA